jgi:hypothetical protein
VIVIGAAADAAVVAAAVAQEMEYESPYAMLWHCCKV